ncbi:MAG: tetratricopeptide repeat protein [Halioglobus sp.]|nr:tetratricopeptide repeat protein [Halioglobus sp.]
MSRLLLVTLALALVAGCATQATVPETQPDPAPTPGSEEPATAQVEVPERRIPDDSVFSLLLAEFALRRRHFDVALEQYEEQAPLLRDPGVSAHTTRLAQYLQDDESALAAAQLWVELDSGNVDANNIAANYLARAGKPNDALPYLVNVERLKPGANFPILIASFAQLTPPEQRKLAASLEELETEFPDSVNLALAHALLFAEQGERDRALAKLDTVLKRNPTQQQALLLEAKLLREAGSDAPYARVEQALAENPDDKLLRMRFARLLTAYDMTAARKQFEILSAQSPGDADLLFSLALINREIGDHLAANAYLRQVIGLDERVDEAYYYLGRIAEEREQIDAAIEHYGQVEDSREFMSATSRAAHILVEDGQFARAGEWFNAQRSRVPERREQLYGLEADILSNAGANDAALALLDRAIAETPDAASLRYSRSMLFEQANDLEAMERELRVILEQDPDNATALNALGYTLANRTTRYAEARELIEQALALQPNEPAILDSMGWVLFRTGHYEEALEYLTRAYAEFPDPEVAAHLGEVMWVSGNEAGARRVWQGAALRDPEHRVLRETLERLGVDLSAGDADLPPGAQP